MVGARVPAHVVADPPGDHAAELDAVVGIGDPPRVAGGAVQLGDRSCRDQRVPQVRGVRAEAAHVRVTAPDPEVDCVRRPDQVVEVDLRKLHFDGSFRRRGQLGEEGGLVAEAAACPEVAFADALGGDHLRAVVRLPTARVPVGMEDGLTIESHRDRRLRRQRGFVAAGAAPGAQRDRVLFDVVAVDAGEPEPVPPECLAERIELRIHRVASRAARPIFACEGRNCMNRQCRQGEQERDLQA